MKNVKLIASDMDHTLLTELGELPPSFESYVAELNNLGIEFVIASGRPLYTLIDMFPELKNKISLISDNGAVIKHKGANLFQSLLRLEDYTAMLEFSKAIDEGVSILCGLDSAYIETKNIEYDDFFRRFFSKITYVENLSEIVTDANKFTVYFPRENSRYYFESAFNPKFGKDFSIAVSGTVWIDIMNNGIDKGNALEILGSHLGIQTDTMMAFGDNFNDAEMLQTVGYSYVVENASEEMKSFAKYIAPSNEDYGVIKIIEEVIAVQNKC